MSWAAASVILVIQLGVSLAGGPGEQPLWNLFRTFGLSTDGILSGKVWQLLTYGLLHGGWVHAGVNSLFVLLIGSRIEHMAGRPALLRVLCLGIVAGGVVHLLFTSHREAPSLLVGISGGCLALLLLLTTLSPQSRMMPLPVSGRNLGVGILVAELLMALMDKELDIPGFSQAGEWLTGRGFGGLVELGHACHFGGGLAGWLYGRWLLRPRVTLQRLRRDRERREAGESRRLS